jgi:hypothetical protein
MGLPQVTDPRHDVMATPNALQRFGLSLINDERDYPFLVLGAQISLVMIPLAAVLFVPHVFRWWLAPGYFAVLFLGFFDRYTLMLHNTSHRVLFKPKYRFLNNYIPWVLGPLMGQSPEGYFGHHMGMHHPENNLEDDLSTTMPYERHRFVHFLHYWFVFMTTSLVKLTSYLATHKRRKLAYKAFIGELLFYAVGITGLILAPGPTLTVFIAPYLAARFLMMWGNWGQHAFIDSPRPENCYVNSITCINTRYNRRCFNDGYHIGHHIKANRHWTEMPEDLEKNIALYAKEGAIVFDGIDFFQVSLYLFLGRWSWLASHYVELDAKGRTKDEIIAFLKSRTKPIVRDLPTALPQPA